MLYIPKRLGYRRVHRALCLIECPCCAQVLASASDRKHLPGIAYCMCDEKKHKEQ